MPIAGRDFDAGTIQRKSACSVNCQFTLPVVSRGLTARTLRQINRQALAGIKIASQQEKQQEKEYDIYQWRQIDQRLTVGIRSP